MLAFLFGLVAGFLTPHAEEPLAEPLVRAARGRVVFHPGEKRLLAFILCLLIAAVLLAVVSEGSPFWLVLGGGLGYFATRLIAAANSR
ncbi:hypothetical protein [Pseudoroseicyclus tamaricis]|uniref:Uncharacterized protein n=1 Tax=Pseudoroseicyclus tamaricis TaxID=2705421 RepID=A0A6B2K2N2_9RHOB|nr:hypothetical protein [Pseudoroseicyclus tamaricis]NDV00726.1 hypothetical protein [Pseudoroseicyclus tamaricis]